MVIAFSEKYLFLPLKAQMMKKILSIDGGGIRGIIPGMLLVALERRLQRTSNDPSAAIVDHFDFFAGTSTGGILTCLLLCPDEEKPLRPKYSAQEALDIYVKHGTDIFKAGFFSRLIAKFGLLCERYPSPPLAQDRKRVVARTSASVRVDHG